MSCKYPKESRIHYACILCDEKNACKDTITFLPLTDSNISMPEVHLSKNVIPSASEANKMTNHVTFGNTQLEDIGKKIRESIEKGKFYIHGEGCLESEVRKKLNELGYEVQSRSQCNEPYYTISWKK